MSQQDFFKTYGLAGLRIGYGIGSKEIIDTIYITKPHNVGTLSQKIATWVLQDYKIYKERIEYIKSERNYLLEELRKVPNIVVFDSDANFILIETKDTYLGEKLKEKEIFVRSFKGSEGTLIIRITIGNKKENKILIETLMEKPQ